MYIYLFIVGAFVVSCVCGFVFIPAILKFCREKQLYDLPDTRKRHKTAVPRLGGISFMPSMVISFVLAMLALCLMEGRGVKVSLASVYMLLGTLLVYATGIVDDVVGLHATPKFLIQIMAASFLPLSGLYINNLYGFCGIHEVASWVGMPLTVFVVVFIDNAMNLIDGIDGLASGLCIIALTGFCVLFVQMNVWVYCMLIGALVGVLVAYSYYNVFSKTQKLFMGDSGSLTLGFILAFLFVKYSMLTPLMNEYRPQGFLMAYSLLIVPVYDVVRVILVRMRLRKPLFDADRHHIHHKLMDMGMTQHEALVTILLMAVFFVVFNGVMSRWLSVTYVVLADVVANVLFHAVVSMIIRRKEVAA